MMPSKDALRRRLRAIPPVLLAFALVHPIARALASRDWRLDLISHFQEPALALTLAAALALRVSRRRGAFALLILAAFQSGPVLRYDLPNPVRAEATAPRLRILMGNVLVESRGFESLSLQIREADPDIVGLVEFTEEWSDGLSEVAKRYPFRYEFPDGARGVALWFKSRPAAIDPPACPTADGWPYLRATIEFAGAPRRLWLLHPSSPMRRRGRFAGFPELDALAGRIAADGGSTIVIGDMNTTDGSPHFRDFLATTGLRDSRLGFGRQASWPVGSPYKIAIDHAFLSPDLAAVARVVGPPFGSDHRPIWLDVAPASSASSTGAASASASAR